MSSTTLQDDPSVDSLFNVVEAGTLALFEYVSFEFLKVLDVFAQLGRTRDHDLPGLLRGFLHCYYKDIYGIQSIVREHRDTIVRVKFGFDRLPSRDAVTRILTHLEHVFKGIFERLVKQRFDEVVVPHTINHEFDRFKYIIAADGTILRLHEFLADEFQPRKGEQGGARSHAQLILHELSQHFGYTPPPLIDRMAEDGRKIHQERSILQERLATATQQEISNKVNTKAIQEVLGLRCEKSSMRPSDVGSIVSDDAFHSITGLKY